jgi:hypothetical protein
MKKKVGTLLDDEVIRHAKRRAAEEGRPLSDVIQDALVSYLSDKAPDPKKRENAYQLFCGQPMRISRKQFKEIVEEDAWDL